MKQDLVSVVIPFYKNISWLEEAIRSVKAQTYKNYEIILINDGSPENDEEFLATYKEEIQYVKVNNAGPGAARNLGTLLHFLIRMIYGWIPNLKSKWNL